MLVLLQAKQKRQPKEKDYFWVQQIPVTDASNIKYVDTIGNNILSGSETFQGDINMNNNRIKNLQTPTLDHDAVNDVFCKTTYRKKVMITNS